MGPPLDRAVKRSRTPRSTVREKGEPSRSERHEPASESAGGASNVSSTAGRFLGQLLAKEETGNLSAAQTDQALGPPSHGN